MLPKVARLGERQDEIYLVRIPMGERRSNRARFAKVRQEPHPP